MFALKCEHVRFLQDFIVWPKCPQTEMSPDWNGPDRNGPDWNSPDRNGQTESARLKSWLSDICWNQKSCNPGYDKTTKWKNVQIHTTDMYESYW